MDAYEEVKARIREVDINWERYDFLDNTGMSDTMAENFSDLSNMSSLLLVFVVVSAVLILSFVFLFWMRNRIHEIGILLSIGRSKLQITTQVLVEGLLIGVVAFLLATLTAPAVSKSVADYLVGYQIQLAEEREQADAGMVASSMLTESEPQVLGVSVKIGVDVVLLACLSTAGIIVVSVLLSGIYVMRQRPKEILSQMS